jgi:hypothetical protein
VSRAAELRLAARLARAGYVQSARALVRRDFGVVVIEVNHTKAVR